MYKLKRQILLTIAYDGTNYCGWQKQKSPAVPTVQQAFEAACCKLFGVNSMECIGASRTDTGVHALGQRAAIVVDTAIPTEKIPLAIRGCLPNDIVVVKAEDVSMEFHPRYDCVNKTYEYKIFCNKYKNPLYRNYSEFVMGNLEVEAMQTAAKKIIGTYDFKAFCAAGATVKTTVRTIFDCCVEQRQDFIVIRVTGNGFLYNMVRILAGTLIAVGRRKLLPEDMTFIIESRDRTKAGRTASPQGLTLMQINY